ncbi:unnamed protein product [Discula destructiva]
MADVKVDKVRFEHYHGLGLLGIGTATPRLSWSLSGTAKNWQQNAYDVEILRSGAAEKFRVDGTADCLFQPWPCTPLTSRETASVRVRVTGSSDGVETTTDWTPWYQIEAGLLQQPDWSAKLIAAGERTPADQPHRPVLFRSPVFHSTSKADGGSNNGQLRARLYITSLGVYEAHINGHRVGDLQMAPGWTSYRHRLPYQTFDVTELIDLTAGNVLGVEVAEGWYAGRLTWEDTVRNVYGDRLGVLAELEIQNSKGDVLQQVVSDESWVTHRSALVTSELYNGEVLDRRDELPGNWTAPAFKQGEGWNPAAVLDYTWDKISLISADVPPVRVTQKMPPKSIFRSKSGKVLIDFGQNLVGKIQVLSPLDSQKDHTLTFRHAEVLEDGELGTRPLRKAKAQDTIIFSESNHSLESWTPRFTFHGFRYVEVTGWPTHSMPVENDFVALVMHSDMERTGSFHSSNELVNQLHANVEWSMRGNFLSVPTDCPQRDERLGWTGDIQVFSPTASFLYYSGGLLANWLQDLAVDQQDAGGIVPLVVPDVITGRTNVALWPQAVWDDVAIILPWVLYQYSGDSAILRRQLPSMQAYIGSIRRDADGLLWDPELWQLGDWLDPNAPPSDPGLARTDGTLVADAYLVYVTELMGRVCTVLGETELAATFERDHVRLCAAFESLYIAPSGLVTGDSQTGIALTLMFGLHSSPEQARKAADRLTRLVKASKFRVSTGFAGTPIILHALSQHSKHSLAYRMLLEKECPSWLYPVTMGATTVWERWDSMLPDGKINPGEMTSFNHYALGSVANWLHEVVGGLKPLAPGWKKFRIGPVPGGDLSSAEVEFLSPYGRIAVKWELTHDRRFVMDIAVPPNAKALVVLPGKIVEGEGNWVGSGSYDYDVAFESSEEWPPKPLSTIFPDVDAGK